MPSLLSLFVLKRGAAVETAGPRGARVRVEVVFRPGTPCPGIRVRFRPRAGDPWRVEYPEGQPSRILCALETELRASGVKPRAVRMAATLLKLGIEEAFGGEVPTITPSRPSRPRRSGRAADRPAPRG